MSTLLVSTTVVFLVGIGYIFGFSHGVRWTLKKYKAMTGGLNEY